ncbi:integrase [Geomonas silvestris]|uniref:Integrase n=1 Tax=Geomonas silvestris TaxID=2740184 RepID=A0A6V8MLT4_9BACT|nr:integrase family protein [Geomonas silvestris]GFO60968.1 integrase [Geomonas silvestris]
MPIIHITKGAVDRLENPESGRVDYFDDVLKGFGVRVTKTGKTYYALGRVNGKQVPVKIGTTDKVAAEEARRTAKGILADMVRGQDPNEEKRQVQAKAEAARKAEEAQKSQMVTLEDALDSYIEHRKLKPKTRDGYRQMFRLHLSDWLQIPVGEITGAMVGKRHTEIANGKRRRAALNTTATKRDGKVSIEKVEVTDSQKREASADGTMRVLRAVLNFTFGDDEDLGIVRPNPVRALSRKKAWYKVPRRRRLVKNSDLPAWNKAVLALDNPIARDYLLFLLYTGLRRNEAARLQWAQVDFDERSFTILDTKNKVPHTLPLSDFLFRLLEERKLGLRIELEAAQEALEASLVSSEPLTKKQRQTIRNRVALAGSRLASPFVFPGEGKSGHIVEPQRAIDEVIQATGIVFSCHDLRRTFTTIAESLDLSKYSLKALLNHKQQSDDVTGGYIILDVERLRDPMQKVTDAIQERIKRPRGRVLRMQTKTQ